LLKNSAIFNLSEISMYWFKLSQKAVLQKQKIWMAANSVASEPEYIFKFTGRQDQDIVVLGDFLS